MVQKEVTASVPEKKDAEGNITQKDLGSTTIMVPYGETAEESTKMFGEGPVNSNAFANWKVVVQAWIRGRKKAGDSDEAIQAGAASLKMGVATAGGKVDPEAAYKAMFLAATPVRQKEMVDELRAGAKKIAS
jgi:hypothetical protein